MVNNKEPNSQTSDIVSYFKIKLLLSPKLSILILPLFFSKRTSFELKQFENPFSLTKARSSIKEKVRSLTRVSEREPIWTIKSKRQTNPWPLRGVSSKITAVTCYLRYISNYYSSF